MHVIGRAVCAAEDGPVDASETLGASVELRHREAGEMAPRNGPLMKKIVKKKKPASEKQASNRPSIYPNKKYRLQGTISEEGSRCFELARKVLAGTDAAKRFDRVSDADTIEFLAREFAARKKAT